MAVSPASIKAVNKEVSKQLQSSTSCAELTGICSQDFEQTTSIDSSLHGNIQSVHHFSKELESIGLKKNSIQVWKTKYLAVAS